MGHRERLRNKFLKAGIEILEKHEILELLLFYAIPRSNTNNIAKDLIKRFGSIAGVFEASLDSLVDIKGLGESSAILIKLIPELSRIYSEDKDVSDNKNMDGEKISKKFLSKFKGKVNEYISLMLLDSKLKMLYFGIVGEGSINAINIHLRKIVLYATKYNATYAVIGHNHPSGVAIPSRNDLKTTRKIYTTLDSIGIRLLDHLIVADGDFVSLASSQIADDIFSCE